jgi:hypothetical protein
MAKPQANVLDKKTKQKNHSIDIRGFKGIFDFGRGRKY